MKTLSDLATKIGGCTNPECTSDLCVLARRLVIEDPVNMVMDIEQFHEKFGLEYTGLPQVLDTQLSAFRIKFLKEELQEYIDATEEVTKELKQASFDFSEPAGHDFIADGLEKQLDALVDLVYVAIGTAYLHGFDFREAWRRVHEANMKKVRVTRVADSKRGSAFDVVKPDGWKAPSHEDLVANHAHKEK